MVSFRVVLCIKIMTVLLRWRTRYIKNLSTCQQALGEGQNSSISIEAQSSTFDLSSHPFPGDIPFTTIISRLHGQKFSLSPWDILHCGSKIWEISIIPLSITPFASSLFRRTSHQHKSAVCFSGVVSHDWKQEKGCDDTFLQGIVQKCRYQ